MILRPTPDDVLLTSLLTAVDAAPDDVPLRLHVAGLLADHGRPADALQHYSQALARDPGNAAAPALLQRLTTAMASPATPPQATPQPGTRHREPRNVVAFANTDGEYDDLSAYLRKNERL